MAKFPILYYSRTGNTDKMAKAVAEGAKTVQGVDVEIAYYMAVENLANFDALAFGVPTYHHDMPLNIKNLLEEAAVKKIALKGKIGAAFGSYGWSGEAPRLVLEILKNKFEMEVVEPPLLIKYIPDHDGLEKCREFEGKVAERLMHIS
ncbi:MAG: flavodoxin domain-containing protein [Candidatus Bathyarchaeota archaeon]|jgi:flavorubredoxin|nr:flavodoxin domain-containing protein [Candidatus Bathyarchaeota archaeon]